ncbi:MAG: polysaccharide biosynthesis C-terminal domain-containing protein [Clostridia bacterium]|nr:polysaccharide biosynthesis C-terminal domain-containing protein [Clostridia bacterium]
MNRKAGVILSYVLMVIEILSTLLLTPFVIRTLGQAEYGVYKLAATLNAYLFLLDLGVGNAVTRFISKYRVTGDREGERRFFGVASVYYLLIALIALAAGFVLVLLFPTVFAKGLSAEEAALGQKLLSITVISAAVTLGTTASHNAISAYERFAVSRTASIVQIILRIGLTFAALKLGYGSIGVVTVNLILTVICRLFYVFYVRFAIGLRPLLRGVRRSLVKEIVAYSSLIFLQMIATQLNSSVDQVLLGALVTSSSVLLAIYGVGAQIVQYYQSLGAAFNGVLMPGVVRMIEARPEPGAIMDEMVRISRLIFMVLGIFWCGFLINGREFICVWAGEKNADAYIVSALLMTAFMFTLTQSIGSQVLWARNEHKEQAILKFCVVLANIILTVALIQWDPLVGAALGTFISIMLGDVLVMNVVFRKKIGISMLRYYKGVIKGILPCLIIAAAVGVPLMLLLPRGWIWLLIKCFAMAAAYIAALWLFGMNDYEKTLVGSLFKKILSLGRNK